MGLAASQARFLGITMRKANCEYKSTTLAQEKLELTGQMSQISEEYASAINATKLTWVNEACESDYGLTYGLLMTPSVANNYDPFMITTKSGAIVLDSKYMYAAKAAGISMAGGIADSEGYKKFIYALGDGTDDNHSPVKIMGSTTDNIEGQNLITRTTQQELLHMTTSGVNWHSSSGLGALPKDKTTLNNMTISDLLASAEYGGQTLDWLQIYRAGLGYSYNEKTTNSEYVATVENFTNEISRLKRKYSKAKDSAGNEYGSTRTSDIQTKANALSLTSGIFKEFADLEEKIENDPNMSKRIQFKNELEYLKKGLGRDGTGYANETSGDSNHKINFGFTPDSGVITGEECTYAMPMLWEMYQLAKYKNTNTTGSDSNVLAWASNNLANGDGKEIGFGKIFHIEGDRAIAGGNTHGNKVWSVLNNTNPNNTKIKDEIPGGADVLSTLTMFVNDVIEMNEHTIKGMTLADLLTKNVVIMAQVRDGYKEGAERNGDYSQDTAVKTLEIAGEAMLDSIARIFGYGAMGTGFNIDSISDEALTKAYDMTMKKFLNAKGAMDDYEDGDDDFNALDNSAYNNANDYNRIGVMQDGNETYAALNLSNMVSTFLTYYDNYLRQTSSEYFVGKSNDGDRTYFVTDDPDYVYITNVENAFTEGEKINDFYNELYNSICEHGWRYDDQLGDYEYLESTIKDGRYSLSSLHPDGFFYQTRYADVDYIVEEQDRDAIARAEADFTRKKAEITNKEDRIDIKTKKLDAEIVELTTELNSVQQLISKSIEKTFAMFSN